MNISYVYKSQDGKNNICGIKIYSIRKSLYISQRILAEMMQVEGIDIDKNAVQRIEAGKRFVTDIELKAFSKVLNISLDELLEQN